MSLEGLIKSMWGSLSSVEKWMIIFTLIVYFLTSVYNPSTREKTIRSLELSGQSIIRLSLLLLSGILLGSFVGEFLPREFISRLLGKESGFFGIFFGTFFGAVIPGGPYVLFPIVASLYSSGATIPPIIAMIFAWQCISLTRIPMDLGYLTAVEGQKIVWLRLLIGIPIPIIVGFLVSIIWRTN